MQLKCCWFQQNIGLKNRWDVRFSTIAISHNFFGVLVVMWALRRHINIVCPPPPPLGCDWWTPLLPWDTPPLDDSSQSPNPFLERMIHHGLPTPSLERMTHHSPHPLLWKDYSSQTPSPRKRWLTTAPSPLHLVPVTYWYAPIPLGPPLPEKYDSSLDD